MTTHRGQQRDKPFRDALRMEKAALEAGEIINHPKGSLRWNAQQLLMKGDIASIREMADRLDGKVPQGVVGGDESETPVRIEWTDPLRFEALKSLMSRMRDDGEREGD